MITLAVNGLGRLGRNIICAALKRDDIEIKATHDIADGAMLAYLFENDSVQVRDFVKVAYVESSGDCADSDGQSDKGVDSNARAGMLEFELKNGVKKSFALLQNVARENLNFGAVDVVVESSGKYLDSQSVAMHLKNGAKKVIISAPASDDTPTFVLGANENLYKGESIISNASCTSNALGAICKMLDSAYGIESGILTTIHSYTNDQNLLDNAHRSDKRRARAAALNIIPTSTGAAKALYKVLPNLKGKFHGHSVRVPVADVSMIDINLKLKKSVSAEGVNALFTESTKGALSGIVAIDKEYKVSSDFIGNSHSAIIAEDLTFCLPCENGSMLKLMAWYDNECGYAHRILDMAVFITRTR
ncbi:type I glyceraldehyde-3-phosphate dehydrogenase [Helicobacter sp. MIT 00-7814]|uniref:type I glyceraldehyde-3-phosphate dehydrogenase n=1 Tax=unclassified Helicobacter TaxID=2593540 RepID=UPI000E1EB6A7|nr:MULTISPECIES: glyceraldehyde 3-phosphate dehydrogenase NAD-binding domain-containing protein [unclassified Helicobacter]RDU55269.1 type I glyceraldehyde-3-phosphate dehydrogenase [Helicobacter sp. MIT 99-10781]RDU56107.1 type I glyceraldehyde-3-phosphate dehydrogenase [Helicobacter sp. MIT 00-7814]